MILNMNDYKFILLSFMFEYFFRGEPEKQISWIHFLILREFGNTVQRRSKKSFLYSYLKLATACFTFSMAFVIIGYVAMQV